MLLLLLINFFRLLLSYDVVNDFTKNDVSGLSDFIPFTDSFVVEFCLDAMILGSENCNYSTSCPSTVCNILANRTLSSVGLAFVVLGFSSPVECTKLPPFLNSTMIVFILANKGKFVSPFSCDNMGDCFTRACTLFNEDKTNIGIGFMGQCS